MTSDHPEYLEQQLLPTVSKCIHHPHDDLTTRTSSLARQYPLPTLSDNKTFSYGTAGFRYKHTLLDGVMLRVGMAAALLSTPLPNQELGVMITASHNDEVSDSARILQCFLLCFVSFFLSHIMIPFLHSPLRCIVLQWRQVCRG
jgi:hypothetical protein